MNIGAIILARLTSSRLPGKGLKKIADKELLQHIVDGLSLCHHLDEIIIATSENPEDDELVSFCLRNGIKYYRGSLGECCFQVLVSGSGVQTNTCHQD